MHWLGGRGKEGWGGSYEAGVLETGDDFVREGVGDDGVGRGAAFPGEGWLCIGHGGGGGGGKSWRGGRCGGCLIQTEISSSGQFVGDDAGWKWKLQLLVPSSLVGCACRIVVPRLLCLHLCRVVPSACETPDVIGC